MGKLNVNLSLEDCLVCRYQKTYEYLEGSLRAKLELQKDGLYTVNELISSSLRSRTST